MQVYPGAHTACLVDFCFRNQCCKNGPGTQDTRLCFFNAQLRHSCLTNIAEYYQSSSAAFRSFAITVSRKVSQVQHQKRARIRPDHGGLTVQAWRVQFWGLAAACDCFASLLSSDWSQTAQKLSGAGPLRGRSRGHHSLAHLQINCADQLYALTNCQCEWEDACQNSFVEIS